MPSLLFVIFIIAVSSIIFFPDLHVASFASRSPEIQIRQGEQAILQGEISTTYRPKDPAPVEVEDEIELVETPKSGLNADAPLIVNIGKLRRGLAENYQTE